MSTVSIVSTGVAHELHTKMGKATHRFHLFCIHQQHIRALKMQIDFKGEWVPKRSSFAKLLVSYFKFSNLAGTLS